MPLLSDYISQVRELVHDLQSVDWTDTEITGFVNNARQRVALDTHCVRTLFTGLETIPSQEIYPISGGIGNLVITNGGSGYLAAPGITIAAPGGGGVTATATSVINSSGVVTDINMTNWGSGYTSAPTVTFASGAATATAVALTNVMDVLSISALWPGNTNRQMLRWLPFTRFQAWCRAYTTWTGYPTAFTNHDEMNQIYLFPIPDIKYLMEWDALTLPTALVNGTDNDTQILQPMADAVQWWASYLGLVKLQNFDQADYFRKAYLARMKEIKATRQDRRIGNIYRATFRKQAQW